MLGVFGLTLPTNLDYPIIAIADLHGQLEQQERLVTRLEMLSEWDDCAMVFLGDYVDRGEDVPGTIDIVVESPGHLFLHCGLSFELAANATEQLAALHRREWNRSVMKPLVGSATDRRWQPAYPVWIGAHKDLSESPLGFPGKVQVTGHVQVSKPDVNPARIRLDTSGGIG